MEKLKQYILKDALLLEIDRQKIGYNVDGKHSVEYDVTRKIIDIINSIEVKEIDLEKELSLDDFFEKYHDLPDVCSFYDAWIFAKYFFELGLKSQKGE